MSEVQTKTQRSRHKEENWLLIRRKLSGGYSKAERLLEALLEPGPRGSGLREVTV